jgi:hypothetical protein
VPNAPERQALDHDLHAEELHVPAAVGHQRVDDDEQVVVDLVELLELGVEVAVEHLDVAGLVDHLGRAVELAVEELHRLGDLGRGHQRALLAVEELRQHPADHRRQEPLALAGVEADAVGLELGEVDEALGQDRHLGVLGIDRGVPGQERRAVPLAGLGALVEVAHVAVIGGVGPVEVGTVAGREQRRRALLAALEQEAAHAGRAEAARHAGIVDGAEHVEDLGVAIDGVGDTLGQLGDQASGQHRASGAWAGRRWRRSGRPRSGGSG